MICPKCSTPILATWYYCPNCGNELQEKPFSLSIGKQIGMYLASFLLAPIGLHWAFRYLKYNDGKAKRVGIIIIILTILSVSLTIGTFMKFANVYSNTLNNLDKINNINDVGKMF